MPSWGYGKMGSDKETVTAHFENIGYKIKEEILGARESIRVCVAWITLKDVQAALVDRAKSGVQVEVIYNDDLINKNIDLLDTENLKLYPIKLRHYFGLMHNKFCIIDDTTVITGSFNWSKRAESHFENCVIIKNNFELIMQFLHEFYDLVSYFSEAREAQKTMCFQHGCHSELFKIGILGQESGQHEESIIGIWEVCRKGGHLKFSRNAQATYISSHLGLDAESDWDENEDNKLDKPAMKHKFSREQAYTQKMQNLFMEMNIKVDAIGVACLTNADDTINWCAEPEYGINMLWRSMYYRKVIPAIIHDGDNDIDLTPIIDMHYFTS